MIGRNRKIYKYQFTKREICESILDFKWLISPDSLRYAFGGLNVLKAFIEGVEITLRVSNR